MRPKLITPASLARRAAHRFKEIYCQHGCKWMEIPQWDRQPKLIHDELVALGGSPSPRLVNDVIASAWERITSDWCRVPTCDSCGADGLGAVVTVGQEPDYESSTANLCRKCVLEALSLFEGDQ